MYFDPATSLLNGVAYSQPTHRPAVPVIPVQGNHEYAGSGTHWYNSYMSLPNNGVSGDAEKYFAFTYGNVYNIGLNTVADDYPKLVDTAAVDQVMARQAKAQTPAAGESDSLLGGSANSPATARAKDALFGDAGVELRMLKLRRLGRR